MTILWLGLWLGVAAFTPLHANETQQAMVTFSEDIIAHWASDPVLASAIRVQNNLTVNIDDPKIDALELDDSTQTSQGQISMTLQQAQQWVPSR